MSGSFEGGQPGITSVGLARTVPDWASAAYVHKHRAFPTIRLSSRLSYLRNENELPAIYNSHVRCEEVKQFVEHERYAAHHENIKTASSIYDDDGLPSGEITQID